MKNAQYKGARYDKFCKQLGRFFDELDERKQAQAEKRPPLAILARREQAEVST